MPKIEPFEKYSEAMSSGSRKTLKLTGLSWS